MAFRSGLGWGPWIRTTIDGVKVRCPAIRRAPIGPRLSHPSRTLVGWETLQQARTSTTRHRTSEPVGPRVKASDGTRAPSRLPRASPYRYDGRPRRIMPSPAPGSVRHRRYRVHARAHLLARTLRGAARRRGGGGGGGRAGPGLGPRTPARPTRGRSGREGVPRGPAGHRDIRAQIRRRAEPAVRYPGRRHGGRVRRPGGLRRAGLGTHQRLDRQGAPVQRLVGPAALGRADRLRRGGRDLATGGVREAAARLEQDGRLEWVAEEMAVLADPRRIGPTRKRCGNGCVRGPAIAGCSACCGRLPPGGSARRSE